MPHFDRVGETSPVKIVLTRLEYLCLGLQPAERGRMDYTVPIDFEAVAVRVSLAFGDGGLIECRIKSVLHVP